MKCAQNMKQITSKYMKLFHVISRKIKRGETSYEKPLIICCTANAAGRRQAVEDAAAEQLAAVRDALNPHHTDDYL